MPAAPPPAGTAVPGSRIAITVFCLLSFGLAWAAAAPLWISGAGLAHPQAKLFIMGMMFSPAVAAFLVLRFVARPASIPRATGMTPLRPARTLIRYCVIGFAIPPLVMLVGVLAAAAAGTYRLDLADFSAFRAFAAPLGLVGDADGTGVPFAALGLFAALQLVGWAAGLPMMFGEEWGWRGYLLPALLHLGTLPALLLHGAIWGLWHAPVILLGYNFGRPDAVGLAAMTAWCVLMGVILGWLRLASGSLWPAVIAHGATNSGSALFVVFGDASAGAGDAVPMALWVASGAAMLLLITLGAALPPVRNAVTSRLPGARGALRLRRAAD
ncbi:CAAX prenyl protease-like protein [Murinocardiopsis flavida]|uniref:CAAX prenyl protease-like protein n=1 Tax=Murinocardiopsis flavida TaxID=645275 RepID=A0A2P8CZ74_9ACTN|nr:CPBP family intramembrane glutamic endopeptidase [Murinocardiopsis flavida]PSK90226.1 CAAX prenyl protease-like protein [Murinocardiopsis flavida]